MKVQRSLSNSSKKSARSVTKQTEIQSSILIRLKYIYNRILDHIKMKKFLEAHEVHQFLDTVHKSITNADEIEAFRKRLKNMLLSINDSIIEFGQAISSGEITFNSVQSTVGKNSITSSGVSTLDESSLSGLALTNSNFLTIPDKNCKIDNIQSQSLRGDGSAMLTNHSGLALSSFALTNRDFKSENNFRANVSYLNHRDAEAAPTNFIPQRLVHSNERKHTQIPNNPQTLKNDECLNKYEKKIISNRNFGNGNLKNLEILSEDLFLQPAPIVKINERLKLKTNVNNDRRSYQKKIQPIKNRVSKLKKVSKTFIPETPVENKNFHRSFNNTMSENIIVETDTTIMPKERYDKVKGTYQVVDIQEENNSAGNNELDVMSDSENSEIFFLNNQSYHIKSNNENTSQTKPRECFKENSHLFKTQPSNYIYNDSLVSTQQNESVKISEEIIQDSFINFNSAKTEDLSKNIDIILKNDCTSSDMFKQSNDVCESGKGVKKRLLDTSTNIGIIAGNLISPTKNNYILVGKNFLSNEKVSLSPPCSSLLCEIKDSARLEKELEEASKESSIILKDLSRLILEKKKEFAHSNHHLSEYNNSKLKFPQGYEDNYKYLEDLLVEFKSDIGISSYIYQVEKKHLFFEDVMNDWTELGNIVEKLDKKNIVKKF